MRLMVFRSNAEFVPCRYCPAVPRPTTTQTSYQIRVWFNNGTGTCSSAGDDSHTWTAKQPIAVDINGDGKNGIGLQGHGTHLLRRTLTVPLLPFATARSILPSAFRSAAATE